jgi:hypothetical protein
VSFELRWIVPNVTTTEPPRLQMRVITDWEADRDGYVSHKVVWSEWTDVPTVVVPIFEFNSPR